MRKLLLALIFALFASIGLTNADAAITWTSYWTNPSTGDYERVASLYTAYDTAGGVTNGEWFSCAGMESLSVEFIEGNTAGITITGDNAATVPLDTAHGATMAAEVTASGFTNFDKFQMPRWCKVRVTTATSGTVDVRVKLHGKGLGNTQ